MCQLPRVCLRVITMGLLSSSTHATLCLQILPVVIARILILYAANLTHVVFLEFENFVPSVVESIYCMRFLIGHSL